MVEGSCKYKTGSESSAVNVRGKECRVQNEYKVQGPKRPRQAWHDSHVSGRTAAAYVLVSMKIPRPCENIAWGSSAVVSNEENLFHKPFSIGGFIYLPADARKTRSSS